MPGQCPFGAIAFVGDDICCRISTLFAYWLGMPDGEYSGYEFALDEGKLLAANWPAFPLPIRMASRSLSNEEKPFMAPFMVEEE